MATTSEKVMPAGKQKNDSIKPVPGKAKAVIKRLKLQKVIQYTLCDATADAITTDAGLHINQPARQCFALTDKSLYFKKKHVCFAILDKTIIFSSYFPVQMIEKLTDKRTIQPLGFVKSLLDASISGVMVIEPVYEGNVIRDFVVRAANKAITEQVGISESSALGMAMSKLFPGYFAGGFFDTYVEALETKEAAHKELWYHDDRIEGWFEIGVAPFEGNIILTFANITSQRLYSQRIETGARQLDAIINKSQSGIFLFSPLYNEDGELWDFVFTKANPAFAAYVGQQPQSLIGAKGSTWFPSYKKNGLFELYSHTLLTGQTNRFDFHYCDDGIDVWLDILSSRLGHEVLVTFTDFTGVKRLQLELEKTVYELKKSNASLEEFAYVASHDLQEPLRKIQYFSERLKKMYGGQNDTAHFVDRMEDATVRMRILIEDLLAYSRFSMHPHTAGPVDLNQLVGEVIADLEASVNEKNAAIHLQSLPAVEGDRLQLRQLFQNIISNALKYNRKDVPLQVSIFAYLSEGEKTDAEVPLHDRHRKFHVVEICDNGVGFEQAYAQRIFKIFQRLHGHSEYPGTGVGLAIVQKVAENHKGYVFARGVPDEGASFRVLFPV